MNYKGFTIQHENGHVVVKSTESTLLVIEWTEDTVEDAKNTIDSMREDK